MKIVAYEREIQLILDICNSETYIIFTLQKSESFLLPTLETVYQKGTTNISADINYVRSLDQMII